MTNDDICVHLAHGLSSRPIRCYRLFIATQSELLGQFRIIGDRASDVSGGRICLTQNAYAEIQFLRKPTKAFLRLQTNLNILNNAQSELLGQFRLTGDRAKKSTYSILYIYGDITMC